MFRKVNFSWLALILGAVILVGCSGDEDEDLPSFLEVSDLRLANLEVIDGGVLSHNGRVVEEFVPDNIGPYSVELDEQSLESITLRATLPDDSPFTISLLEIGKDEDNATKFTEDIASGTDISAEIEQGINLIFVRVTNESTGARTDYFIQVNRISSSADLAALQILGQASELTGIAQFVSFEPDFDAEVTEYTATIDDTFCEVQVSVARDSTSADVEINGENLISDYIVMNEGENLVVIDVTSEDGQNTKQYNITITREEASDDTAAGDPRLSAISYSEGRTLTDFRCTGNDMSQFVTNAVTSIGVTVETERETSSLTIGDAVLDDSEVPEVENFLWVSENDETLTAGVEYTGDLLTGLEEGSNFFVVTSVSSNESSTTTFLINIIRSENNEVFVTNAEELQAALKNAQPNDDILMAEGDYTGVVSVEDSGNETAHFFSDVDGTADDPIKLRALESGVRLLGDNMTQNTVLLLQGDYWEVSGFEVSGGQNGIVLDGASFGLLGDIDINNVGERGFSLVNGSSNNELSFMNIDHTGIIPRETDGSVEVFEEAIVIGDDGGLASDNNAVRNIRFGYNIAEAIDIKQNAADTVVQNNIFSFDNTLLRPTENRSVITLASTNNNISLNQFSYDEISSANEEQDVVHIIEVTSTEGSSSNIYQNTFSLDGQDLVAIDNEGAGTVLVDGNKREDGDGVLSFEGEIDASFVNPIYQIQSVLDPTQCLAIRDVVLGDDPDAEPSTLVVAAECADEDAQRWEFIHESDGFVFIAQASNLSNKIFGVQSSSLGVREDTGGAFDGSFSLRWRVLFSENEVRFSSKADESDFITETEDAAFENTDLVTPVTLEETSIASDLSRAFTLIQLN